jgi:putative ABC transport system permease protein
MPETDIGWVGLAASLVLVVVAVVLSWTQRLRLERSIVWASLRAAAQLLIVGWALALILEPGRPVAWAWLWVVAMVLFAGFTVRRRAPEVPSALLLSITSMAAVAVVSLGVIFGLGIFPVEARTIVPLAGMMIGNSMAATVLAGRRVVGELRDNRREVEARLALGHPWPEAARPYVRSSLRDALLPQIEQTKAVGLVILPGAMTGLILAGVDAVDAVQIQLAIMYLILGSVATSVTVVGLGLTRRLFTPDHRLLRLTRTGT